MKSHALRASLRAHSVVVSLTLVAGVGMSSANAASSATSIASESATSTASSASDSLKGSSNSSSRGTGMAAGNYQLMQVAELADRPGMVQMKLARLDDTTASQDVEVSLPRAAFENSLLLVGGRVAVREKAYGLELTNGSTQQAFFLVLADEWHRELGIKPVVL